MTTDYHPFTSYQNLQDQMGHLFAEREKLMQSGDKDELNRVDTLYQRLRPQLEALKPLEKFIAAGAKKLSGPGMRLTLKNPTNDALEEAGKVQAINELTICEFGGNTDLTPLKNLPYLTHLTLEHGAIEPKAIIAICSLSITHLTFKQCKRALGSGEFLLSAWKNRPTDDSFLMTTLRQNKKLKELTLIQMPFGSDKRGLRLAQNHPVHVRFQSDRLIEGQGILDPLQGQVTYDQCLSFSYLRLHYQNWDKVDVKKCPTLTTLCIWGPAPIKGWFRTNLNLIALAPSALTQRSWMQTIRKLILYNQTLNKLPTLPKQTAHLVLIYGVGPLLVPNTIQKLTLNSCPIEDKDIEGLPKTLKKLTIFDCPKVNIPLGRLRLLFKECTFKGFGQEKVITQELRKLLETRVMGQPQALEAAFPSLLSALGGVAPKDRPIGVMFFTGPSGTGKTELAKAIAEILKRKLLRYDMSEYNTAHEAAKLIGAPPGYVGYGKGGKLTNEVRTHPNAIVLLDEAEKADPRIHDTFLQVFDAGRLTDGQGRTTDFSQTIIIMTSNLGAQSISKLNWSQQEKALELATVLATQVIKKHIKPEYAGRIDAIVPFRPLTHKTLAAIMKQRVVAYQKEKEKEYGLHIQIGQGVWQPLLKGLDPDFGVRPAIRKFEKIVNGVISGAFLNQAIQKGDKISIKRDNAGKVVLALTSTD